MEDTLVQEPIQAQQPIDKGEKLYNNLVQAGFTETNLGKKQQFLEAIKNPLTANKIYSGLRTSGLSETNLGSLKDFQDTFSQKKSPTDNASPNTSNLSTLGSNPSQVIPQKIQRPDIASLDNYVQSHTDKFANQNSGGIAPSPKIPTLQDAQATIKKTNDAKNTWGNFGTFAPNVILGGLAQDLGKAAQFIGQVGTHGPMHMATAGTVDPLVTLGAKLEGSGNQMQQVGQQNALPNTTLGNVASTGTRLGSDLLELALTPELDVAKLGKLGTVLGKYGTKAAEIAGGKFPLLMGTKGLTSEYVDAKDKGASDYDAAKSALANAGKEYVKGAVFEGAGQAASKVSDIGKKLLTDNGWMAGNKIVAGAQKAILNSSAQATAFSAVPFVTNAIDGKSTTLDDVKQNAIFGGMLGLFHGSGAKETDSHAANGSAAQVLERAPLIDLHNFANADIDAIKEVHDMPENAADLKIKSAVGAQKAFDAETPEEKQQAIVQSSTDGKAASVKTVTEAILKDKQAVIDAIPDDLPSKPELVAKINEVHKELDPTEQIKTKLGNQISDIDKQLGQLKEDSNNGNPFDAAFAVKHAENEVRAEALIKQREELNNQLKSIILKQQENESTNQKNGEEGSSQSGSEKSSTENGGNGKESLADGEKGNVEPTGEAETSPVIKFETSKAMDSYFDVAKRKIPSLDIDAVKEQAIKNALKENRETPNLEDFAYAVKQIGRPEEIGEQENAANQKQITQSGEQEHQKGNKSGETTETSGSNSPIGAEKGEKSIGEPTGDTQTTLRDADVEVKRKEYGFNEPIVRKGTTDKELEQKAESEIKNGYDAYALMDKVLNDKTPISGVESVILAKFQGEKESELLKTNKDIEKSAAEKEDGAFNKLLADRDRILDDLQRSYDASESSGTVASDALRARKISILRDYSLANLLIRKRAVNGGERLSEQQVGEIETIYKSLKEKETKLNEHIAELQHAENELLANKAIREIRKEKRSVKIEELNKEIESVFENIHKITKEKQSTLSANPIPIEYIPEIAKLVKLYSQKGIIKLSDIVDSIYTELKDDIDGLTKEHVLEAIAQSSVKDPLKAVKSRMRTSLSNILRKTGNNDFSREKKNIIKLDKEGLELRRELDRAKQDFDIKLAKEELNQRTKNEKLKDDLLNIASLPRALKASLDFSAVLRQGLFLVPHLKESGTAFKEMFGQTFSEKRYRDWISDLKHTEMYDLMKKSDLYLSDKDDPNIIAREEEFTSNLADKIPLGIGKAVKASERAYTGYLNVLRAGVFTSEAQKLIERGYTFEKNPEEFKSLAKVVNVLSGRGDIPEWLGGKQPKILSNALFSPRFMAARIQTLYLWADPRLSKNAKVLAAKDIGKTLASGAAILSLAALAGYKVVLDPRSANFLKVEDKQKHGSTFYDVTGGLAQYVRLLAQLATGKRKPYSGGIQSLTTGGYGKPTRLSVATSFMRGKLSPLIGAGVNLMEQKDVVGNPYHLWPNLPMEFLPLPYSDVQEAYKVGGIDDALKVFLPSQFGVSVSSYNPKAKPKK